MGNIWHEISRAATYLLMAGVVSFAWKLGLDNARGGKYKHVLWKGLLWCGAIALFTSFTLGSATCEVQSDPVYGGCDQYADNGYTPTTEQRVGNFVYFMTLLYVPVAIGAYYGRKKNAEPDQAV